MSERVAPRFSPLIPSSSEILALNRSTERSRSKSRIQHAVIFDLPAGDIPPFPDAGYSVIENACGAKFKMELQIVDNWGVSILRQTHLVVPSADLG